jgi:hypothetical protein
MQTDRPNQGPLKSHWEFQYPVERVLGAARNQAKHRKDRLAWWQQELDQSEARLKEKGFEYRKQRHSSGEEVRVVGDPELARRVAECA